MRLATVDQLERPNLPCDPAQSVEVAKQQIRSLVRSRAASEPNRKHFVVELNIGLGFNGCNQIGLGATMRFSELLSRNVYRVAKIGIIVTPFWNLLIEKPAHRRAGPSSSMYPVGDGTN